MRSVIKVALSARRKCRRNIKPLVLLIIQGISRMRVSTY